MNLSESDRWFGPWGSAGGRAQEPNENDRKIEAPVEAILHFGQIAIGILIEVEGMIGSGHRGLQVGQRRVDPAEGRVLDRLLAGAHDMLVGVDQCCQGAEAAQAIGERARVLADSARFAQFSTASPVKPDTRERRTKVGWSCSVVCIAAMKGTFLAARGRFPRWPRHPDRRRRSPRGPAVCVQPHARPSPASVCA
jgi:hypothetical protein